MSIVKQIRPLITKALKELYDFDISEQDVTINTTKPEFEGDYTLVLFSFIKSIKRSPEQTGKDVVISMVHANIPDNQLADIRDGWKQYYWEPWKNYLAGKIPALKGL